MTAVATRRRAPMKPLAPRGRQGYLFISPWLIGFVAFTALPMLATPRLHLHQPDSQPGGAAHVGFENYADLAADAQAGTRSGSPCVSPFSGCRWWSSCPSPSPSSSTAPRCEVPPCSGSSSSCPGSRRGSPHLADDVVKTGWINGACHS